MSFGDNVRALREKQGLSQTRLAEETGVSQSIITQIERGTKSISLQLAVQFTKVFGCTLDDLVKSE